MTLNRTNGDVAICYFEKTSTVAYLRVNAYSNEGEELFSKRLFAEGQGYGALLYFGEFLYVYVGLTQTAYCYDRNGNKCDLDAAAVRLVKESGKMDGWKSTFGGYKYILGDYVYTYERPALFKYRSRLTVSDGKETKTIFEFGR